jgi:hypothetical protein
MNPALYPLVVAGAAIFAIVIVIPALIIAAMNR